MAVVFSLGTLGCGTDCECSSEGCNVTVCLLDCDGNPITDASASVEIMAPGGEVSCETETGCCGLNITTAGTYLTYASASGYNSFAGNVTYSCGGTADITLWPTSYNYSCVLTVYGCTGPLEGATVTCNGNTYTTNSSGEAVITFGQTGEYGWTVSASRFVSQSGTFDVTEVCANCTGSTTVYLEPASGYVCPTCVPPYPVDGNWPWPVTLYLTDSQWGTCTLTYALVDSVATWSCTIDIDWPAYCGCAEGAWTSITYQLTCCVLTIQGNPQPEPATCIDLYSPNAGSGTQTDIECSAIPVEWSCSIPGCGCEYEGMIYQCWQDGTTYTGGGVLYPTDATITITE